MVAYCYNNDYDSTRRDRWRQQQSLQQDLRRPQTTTMRAEELNAVVAIEKSKTGAMFMSSSAGELFDHLHSIKSKESSLSWELRLKIAAETAGALAYLHSSTSMPIIHQDVNIISTKLLRHTRNEIHSKHNIFKIQAD
ncbi:hypothetical protein COP1_004472 [Malus domestica]